MGLRDRGYATFVHELPRAVIYGNWRKLIRLSQQRLFLALLLGEQPLGLDSLAVA